MRLFNVLPYFPSFYMAYSGLFNSIFDSNKSLSSVINLDSPNLVNRQFGIPWPRAVKTSLPSFANAVLFVLSICSQKQMIRVYTQRNIACMATMQSLWDGAAMKFIRHTVGSYRLAFKHKQPIFQIFPTTFTTCPNPAARDRIYFDKFFKPFHHWFSGDSDSWINTTRHNCYYKSLGGQCQ